MYTNFMAVLNAVATATTVSAHLATVIAAFHPPPDAKRLPASELSNKWDGEFGG